MASKHIHKLKKHKYKSEMQIYFCTLPDCHFKIEVALSLGKECLCNICGNPFILSKASLRLNEPHCNNCGRFEVKDADGKKHYEKRVASRVLSSIASKTVEDLETRLHDIVQSTNKEDDI